MYRQGDLLFIKTDKEPEGKQLKTKVLICSSVTGNSHKVSKGIVFDNGDNRPNYYVQIPEGGAKLLHEEHETIDLPQGTYEVIRQREVTGYVED